MAQRCPRIRLVKAKRWTGQCWTRPDFTVSLLSRIKMVEILNAWNRLRNVILYSTAKSLTFLTVFSEESDFPHCFQQQQHAMLCIQCGVGLQNESAVYTV